MLHGQVRGLDALRAVLPDISRTTRAYALAKEVNPNFGQATIRTEEECKVLFGQTAAVVK
jgi:GST-like protein